jgi:hypothetical protein
MLPMHERPVPATNQMLGFDAHQNLVPAAPPLQNQAPTPNRAPNQMLGCLKDQMLVACRLPPVTEPSRQAEQKI